MRNIFVVCFAVLFLLTLADPGYCDGPAKKLGRGLCNLATSPLEIFYRMFEAGKQTDLFGTLTCGFVEGVCKMGFRAMIGLYEVVTFPFPVPEGYEPIVKDPEFFWPSLQDKAVK